LPSSVSEEEVAYIGAFFLCVGVSIFSADLASVTFIDDGMALAFHNRATTTGESGNGWVEIETVLVRLNKNYLPNMTLPVWSPDTIVDRCGWTAEDSTGYDAVVCVEMYEPWIVQIYNSSLGIPTTMAIVNKSATTDFETDSGNRGPHLDSYTRTLNSTGKDSAYYAGYDGSLSFERC